MTIQQSAEPRTKRWTREEFYQLAEEGYFRGKRVQLIDGEIIEMAPQGHPHSKAITYLTHWAVGHFGKDHLVRIQMPLNADDYNDPEPDIAIIPGPAEDYTDHPQTAKLIIEVSDSSIHLDRVKAGIYARSGVPEYWIVNIQERQMEVYRRSGSAKRRYDKPKVIKPGESLSPLFNSKARLAVTELFA
jgi:Uma2 family endonuclease